MWEFRSKKGYSTVFICIIFSSMIMMVMMFITLTAKQASISYGSSLLNLAGRSILSEFDEELKERYDLIAFMGDGEEIAQKIAEYVDYSLDNNRYIEINQISCELSADSLSNVDTFREQVTEDGLCLKDVKRVKGRVETNDRVLRSSRTLNDLPSHGYELDTPGIRSLANMLKEKPDGENLIRKGTKTFLTNEYIMKHFASAACMISEDETFFNGEIEYILEGKTGDEANVKEVLKDMKELRLILNSLYLWENEAKKAEALAAAELISPGPGAVAVQAVILEEWALIEAEADIKLLKSGGCVPYLKTSKSWQTSIEGVIDHVHQEPKDDSDGASYDDYLKVLLCTLSDETKYLRMMDLIQINLQGTYLGCFSLKDMYTGFQYSASVNGRNFTYEQEY